MDRTMLGHVLTLSYVITRSHDKLKKGKNCIIWILLWRTSRPPETERTDVDCGPDRDDRDTDDLSAHPTVCLDPYLCAWLLH